MFENAFPLCNSRGAGEEPCWDPRSPADPARCTSAEHSHTEHHTAAFHSAKEKDIFSLFSSLSVRPQLSSVEQNSNFPSKKKKPLPLIVHPGGGRILLSIVLNHWTGRKQQSNHITVSLGKRGQLSTGNVLRLIPARPRLFFFGTESTFHNGFWRHAGL